MGPTLSGHRVVAVARGLGWGLFLVAPGQVVSAVLERTGATTCERYGCQFATTAVFLLVLDSFRRESPSTRRRLEE